MVSSPWLVPTTLAPTTDKNARAAAGSAPGAPRMGCSRGRSGTNPSNRKQLTFRSGSSTVTDDHHHRGLTILEHPLQEHHECHRRLR